MSVVTCANCKKELSLNKAVPCPTCGVEQRRYYCGKACLKKDPHKKKCTRQHKKQELSARICVDVALKVKSEPLRFVCVSGLEPDHKYHHFMGTYECSDNLYKTSKEEKMPRYRQVDAEDGQTPRGILTFVAENIWRGVVRTEPFPGLWRITDGAKGEPPNAVTFDDVPPLFVNSGTMAGDIQAVWWSLENDSPDNFILQERPKITCHRREAAPLDFALPEMREAELLKLAKKFAWLVEHNPILANQFVKTIPKEKYNIISAEDKEGSSDAHTNLDFARMDNDTRWELHAFLQKAAGEMTKKEKHTKTDKQEDEDD